MVKYLLAGMEGKAAFMNFENRKGKSLLQLLASVTGIYKSQGNAHEKSRCVSSGFSLAEWTGLEPATPGVTGRYSNQLNYHS